MNRIRNGTRQQGAVLIEFALILPIMMTLILGIIEIGWALFIQSTLTDGAREGARVAVTQTAITNLQIAAAIDNILVIGSIPSATAAISIIPVNIRTQAKGTAITVEVSLPYSSVSILPVPLFLGGATLSASVTMVKEY